MKIFYKTSATATGGRDGRTQVDDGSIGFDLVSFQNDGTGADEKHQRAEYGKHRRTDEKRPHRRKTAAPTKNGRMGWVKNLFMVWLNSA